MFVSKHMRRTVLFVIIGSILGAIGVAALLFVSPLSSKAQTAWRMAQSEIRKLNPPDPLVPAPSVAVEDVAGIIDRKESPTPAVSQPDDTTPTASPSPTLVPPPESYTLPVTSQEYQKWNNCGPATVTMFLRALGYEVLQDTIAAELKPNPDDKNVNPDEIEEVVSARDGITGLYRINGDMTLLKQFISRGYPVVAEIWFEREPDDGMGHYVLVKAYDDASQKVTIMDSYRGPNIALSYDEFTRDWKVYNETYIVAYTPEQEEEVRQLVGEEMNDTVMYANAQAKAEEQIRENEEDAYAWYNLGTALSRQGEHEKAATAFDKSRHIGLPWRMLWYQFAIFESYLAVGRYEEVITLADTNLNQSRDLEESHYYRGLALEGLDRMDEAQAAFQRAVEFNPNYDEAQEKIN